MDISGALQSTTPIASIQNTATFSNKTRESGVEYVLYYTLVHIIHEKSKVSLNSQVKGAVWNEARAGFQHHSPPYTRLNSLL
jgi:hypothetical protein